MQDRAAASPPGTPPRVDFAGINALATRPAGYAVALKCLQVQADAEDMDPSLRSDRHVRLHPDAWSWYQGALGEIEVGSLLGVLGPEWFVRHSVPIGADTKDVDHLVIGPGGVFAINTKHHAGASVWVGDHVLRVNNANTSHLKIARSDALDVSRRLAGHVGFPVPVTPVLAVLNARALKDGRSTQNRSIVVKDARQLVAWLRSQPAQLSPTKIELLKLAAEEPTTWHVDPRAADTLRVMQRFERLVARAGQSDAHASRSASPTSTRRAATGTRSGGAPGRTATPSGPRFSDLLRAWLGATIVVAAILIIRGVADQPCGSPLACVFPSVYAAWRPLMLFGGLVAVALALLRTGQYALPRTVATLRRRLASRPPRSRRAPTSPPTPDRHERHPMNPPAGWYADPVTSGIVRYWSGTAWTEHTAPHQPVPHVEYGAVSDTAAAGSSYGNPGGYVPMQSHSSYSPAPTPHYVVAVPPRNSKATRALVWGIICVIINPFALPSILAIVFGVQSRTTATEMERAGIVDSGRGRATAGIVLGCIGAAFFALWMVFYVSQALIPRVNG